MDLVMERDQLFINSPIKGFLWNLLPSPMDLRNQIQVIDFYSYDNEERRPSLSFKKKKKQKFRKSY